ncbi:mechanosensitive ion channel family protein [Collinsella sp.]|uniref:mechanosensitive ion channel family protein n=1 Tax=Collinsella sp. TaxID=1965294 RepID=UPI003FF0555A
MFTFFKIPFVQSVLWAIALIVATAIIARIASRALRHFLERDSNPLPSSSIIINIARGVIWATGASVILDACFGVNANALVAALGVGGIAVSLGFQDTLSNLIGGLQVTFMGIVKPGDNIEVGAERGVVQDVTWRHTTIRDAMGQTVIIPNSIISKTALVHLLPASRVAVPFAVPRLSEDGSPHAENMDGLAEQLADLALKAAREVSPVIDGPRVLFSEISELGIKGKIVFQVEDAAKTSAAADAVVRAIATLV